MRHHHSFANPTLTHAHDYIKRRATLLSISPTTSPSGMDPFSSSSPGWTTTSAQPLLSPTMCPLDFLSCAIPTITTTLPAQLHLPFTSHSHDTPTLLSTSSSPTGAVSEALNNLFLVGPSDDYKRTAELLDISLPSYIDGPYPPSPPSIFDTSISETAGMAVLMSLAQQQQIGDLATDQHDSGGAGTRQPVSGWGIVETAGFLLDGMHSSTTASSSRMSSNDDPWIEQFLQLQQQQYPPPPPIQQPEEPSSYPQGRRKQEYQQQILQEQWLLWQKQQPQYNIQSETTVSNPDHFHPQHSMWPLWLLLDQQQQQIALPQQSLQPEHPISNPHHHTPHILPTDYFQQHQGCPPLHTPQSPSSLPSPFEHRQNVPLSYNTFEHPYNQQQQPHPDPLQQYNHLRRNSTNHRHLYHNQHPHLHHLHHHHRSPMVQSLKRRRRLTTEESEFLMLQFNLNGRPTAQERDSFARHLKLDRRTIQVWFQNRRAKLKRDERGQGESAGGSGGGGGDEGEEDGDGDDDERGSGDREEDIMWKGGAGVVGEGGLGGQEPRYPQQMILQDHHQHTVDGLSRLLPPHQYHLPPPPHAFDIFDLEGEGSGDSEDLGLDFLQTWNINNNNSSSSSNNSNNSEANYTTITPTTATTSSSDYSSRGEMMVGMGVGVGLAETARLGMELLSGQHCQSYQYQYQHQYRYQQDADHLPHPLQRWSLPLVESGASFRDCPP